MIRIVFFAQLRERLGLDHIDMLLDSSLSLLELRNLLISQYPKWEVALNQKNILMSVNREYASLESLVNAGDEVAFFPPVTGG